MRNLLHILSHWIRCHGLCMSLIITIVSPQKFLFKGWVSRKHYRSPWGWSWPGKCGVYNQSTSTENLTWFCITLFPSLRRDWRTQWLRLGSAHHLSQGRQALFEFSLWTHLLLQTPRSYELPWLPHLAHVFSIIITGQKDHTGTSSSSLMVFLHPLILMWRKQLCHGVLWALRN